MPNMIDEVHPKGMASKNNTMTKICSRPWCRSIVEIFISTHNELLLSSWPSPNKLSASSPRYILSKQNLSLFHNGAAKDSKVGWSKKCYSLSVLSSHPFMKPGGSGFVDGGCSITKHIKSKDWNILYFIITHCSTPSISWTVRLHFPCQDQQYQRLPVRDSTVPTLFAGLHLRLLSEKFLVSHIVPLIMTAPSPLPLGSFIVFLSSTNYCSANSLWLWGDFWFCRGIPLVHHWDLCR